MTGSSSYLPPFSRGERDEYAARTGASLDDALLAGAVPDVRESVSVRRPRPIEPRTVDVPIHGAGAPMPSVPEVAARRDADDVPASGPTYADFLGDQVDD